MILKTNRDGNTSRRISIQAQTSDLKSNPIIPLAALHHIGNGCRVEYQLCVSVFACLGYLMSPFDLRESLWLLPKASRASWQ